MHENRSMPPSTVIPVLAYADVSEAVGWLCNVVTFSESIADVAPEDWGGTSHRL